MIYVTSAGQYLPKDSISNEALVESFNHYVDAYNKTHEDAITRGEMEPLAPSSAAFIQKASGITRRHVVDKEGILDPKIMAPRLKEHPLEEAPSLMAVMGAKALQDALDRAGLVGEDIDVVICASSAFARSMPALAIEIQGLVGTNPYIGFGFDMNVACASATFGIGTAMGLIQGGLALRVAVVSVEVPTAHLNFRNRDSHFIFGDGASAVIVEHANNIKDLAARPFVFEIEECDLVSQFSTNIQSTQGALDRSFALGGARFDFEAPDSPKLFRQEGRRVFREVCPMVARHIDHQLVRLGIDKKDVKKLWLHQANQNMIDLILRTVMGKDADKTIAPLVLDKVGNTSSASCIMALLSDYQMEAGQYGVLASFGAGYALGSLVLRKVDASYLPPNARIS